MRAVSGDRVILQTMQIYRKGSVLFVRQMLKNISIVQREYGYL